jgi:hypothetical protein
MRALARASALVAVAALALPGCIVAIGTSTPPDEWDEDGVEASDKEEAQRDSRLLDLEKRLDRLEEHLAK